MVLDHVFGDALPPGISSNMWEDGLARSGRFTRPAVSGGCSRSGWHSAPFHTCPACIQKDSPMVCYQSGLLGIAAGEVVSDLFSLLHQLKCTGQERVHMEPPSGFTAIVVAEASGSVTSVLPLCLSIVVGTVGWHGPGTDYGILQ